MKFLFKFLPIQPTMYYRAIKNHLRFFLVIFFLSFFLSFLLGVKVCTEISWNVSVSFGQTFHIFSEVSEADGFAKFRSTNFVKPYSRFGSKVRETLLSERDQKFAKHFSPKLTEISRNLKNLRKVPLKIVNLLILSIIDLK